jgi:Predicted enzyme related to lactoylglutathione lyase
MAKKLVHIEIPAKEAGRGVQFWSGFAGWQIGESAMPGMEYRMFEGEPGGAVMETDEVGPGIVVYFGSDDIDADVARVRELGGEADDKQPIPHVGWFARCKDTEGNPFSLFQSDESVAPPA